MPHVIILIDGESGLEGKIAKSLKIVPLTKPTLHVEICQTTEYGLRREELLTKAKNDKETYYMFRYCFGDGKTSAVAYNTFKRRETSQN